MALETLKQLKATADTCAKTESEDSWSALMRQAKACQAKLRLCCEELSKGDVLAELAARATRQRKKRERLRRQRLEKEQEAEEVAKHVALVEARINAQRQRIIDKANQDRQEAEMKDEADSILSEIRFKINRTREYLDRLCAMEQLRAARKESYQQKGEHNSTGHIRCALDSVKYDKPCSAFFVTQIAGDMKIHIPRIWSYLQAVFLPGPCVQCGFKAAFNAIG